MSQSTIPTLNDSGVRANDAAPETAVRSISEPHAIRLLPEEIGFYDQYPWVLNAFPTIREILDRLREQLRMLEGLGEGWQQREVITNIFLLACSVTDAIDDYVAGNTYDFSKVSQALPPARLGVAILTRALAVARTLRETRMSSLRTWSEAWRKAVTDFLQHTMVDSPSQAILVQQCAKLVGLLPPSFPKRLWDARPKVPAFFRSRDFAPSDCLELGKKFVQRFPDGERPTIILGLRTAGSFLAPLLCAYLRTRFPAVDWIAVRPKKDLATSERTALRQATSRRARVLVVDESIHSGQTLVTAVTLLRRMGFKDDDIVVLNPAEPAFPDWRNSSVVQSVPKIHTITLEPAERYKQRLLDSDSVNALLNEYFRAGGYANARIMSGADVERINAAWRSRPPERVDIRLKRVFEVHLRDAAGRSETRYVLAKSVGWGWLGYHAFQAGRALQKFVPPMLGLREGILYTEWLPQQSNARASVSSRQIAADTLGSYVAARARRLKFAGNPAPDLVRERRHKGLEMLAGALSRAYGSRIAAAAQRSRIQETLSQSCGLSVLTDSKMASDEWISVGARLIKTDFEHHGQGKNELGMTDPAYDLADAVFHFGFSEEQERRLVDKYAIESGDVEAEARLFPNKLLAGLWAQNLATLGLENPRLAGRGDEFHRQYISAWNFLVSQTVRECGKLSQTPRDVSWRSPLVIIDVDGVLDRMVFGFPSTTAAGIKALSLLACHGFTVALNTARTLREVKEYCHAYGLAGGVAEYGGVAWDYVQNRQVSLVDAESMRELEEARGALRRIPGVFLNEDYQYSLRAFNYQNGRTLPLPHSMAQDLLAGLKLNRLHVHRTGLDTAITAKETDKGTGLRALLSLAGLADADVIAVGDSEPDLAMFRGAGRSFAPGNVSCRKEAQLLGCHIATSAYQPGLLEIARKIIHPEGGDCNRCRDVDSRWRRDERLFVSLLDAADRKPLSLLLRNCFDPAFLRAFRT
jgi:hydroxymethylpyrimidine pyrophosphatase-like HAD family hydrolase/hypoxanthine phosphoribosyltransferase